MTRRFDIGPLLLGLGAIVLLVSLFLTWMETNAGAWDAWQSLEVADVLLAALAVAALVAAVGMLTDAADYIDRRFVPWIVGAALVIVANVVLGPTTDPVISYHGTGAWTGFGATAAMVLGALLTFSRVSFAVSVEGRDRRRRVAAVDHRPPTTETGAPVARSSTSLLKPTEPEAGEGS